MPKRVQGTDPEKATDRKLADRSCKARAGLRLRVVHEAEVVAFHAQELGPLEQAEALVDPLDPFAKPRPLGAILVHAGQGHLAWGSTTLLPALPEVLGRPNTQHHSGCFEVHEASRCGGLHTGRIGSVRPLLIQHSLLPLLDGIKIAQKQTQ